METMETVQQEQQNAAAQSMRQFGQESLPQSLSPFHCLTIIGQIEGHMVLPARNKTTKYEHILPMLVAIEQNPSIKGLMLILNTVGGDIEAGLAIAEMIKSMKTPTVSLVLGGGHSIGIPIAVAARHSFIAETATMTLHPIRLTGLVIGVPQTYEYLDKMQERVNRFIVHNSKLSQDRLKEMMFRTGELVRDVGTVLIGDEAVKVGLIDEIGGLEQGLTCLANLAGQQESVQQPSSQPFQFLHPFHVQQRGEQTHASAQHYSH